jgi:hypothetical protein
MTARKGTELGIKTIVVAVGLTIIFMVGAMVAGMAKAVPATTGTAAPPAVQPGNYVPWLFVASLVQALVVTYLVLEGKWDGWKTSGALFLVVLNMWAQTAIESAPYLRGHVSPSMSARSLAMGLVVAVLFAPFAVWVLGGFRRGAPEGSEGSEGSGQRVRWSAARWAGTLAATTVAFVALYYLCGYYIAWQSAAVRQFYSGTTAIRTFWGQIAWTWSSTPWMFALQAGRALLFVAMTLPAVRMLRGGARRVALGTALMYAAWDGSPGLMMPNPIMPSAVAHAHAVELAVWGLLFGAFTGWSMSRAPVAKPAGPRIAEAA